MKEYKKRLVFFGETPAVKRRGLNYIGEWNFISKWCLRDIRKRTWSSKGYNKTMIPWGSYYHEAIFFVFISRWNMIIPVSVVLNGTVVDSDWRFDNVCGSHLQQDYTHPDDHIPPTYEMTPGFKPFTFLSCLFLFNSIQSYNLCKVIKILSWKN